MMWRISLVTGAMLLASGAARADVLEIGDNGAVRVRTGGGDVQWIEDAATAGAGDASAEAAPDFPAPDFPADAMTEMTAPQVPAAYGALLQRVADDFRVSPDLLAALVWQESRWHPAALSAKGAVGLAQLMPATARAMSVDARDPAANLAGGARYLRQMLDLFDGDVERALAAYNAGPGRVQRAGGVPRIAETQAYVATIIDRLSPAAVARSQGLLK